MDNFKRQGNRRSNSFDGMTGNNRPSANGMPARQQIGASQFNSSNRLDNFRGVDGFHPSQQPAMQSSDRPNTGRNPRRAPDGTIDLSLSPAPAKPRKRRNVKRVVLRSFAGVTVTVMALVGFLFGKGYLKLHQIFKGGAQGAAALQDNVDPNKLRGEGDGRVNILLLGKGGAGHEGADLTDTLMIASIDPINKQAALLSIPRDLWVTPSGLGEGKINAVYANAKSAALSKKQSKDQAEAAGLNAIQKEIQEDIGIPIHYHVMMDFAAFQQAIDTVGGVDINVPSDLAVRDNMYDEVLHKPYLLDVKAGTSHFDGRRGLFFARTRHTSARGDFDRSERQRLLIVALKDKVLSAGTYSNPVKISGLIDAFGNHIQSDLSINDVMRLYDIIKNINSSQIQSVGLADPPNNYVTTANLNGLSIVRPRAGLYDFSEVQNFVRNKLKDGFMAKENASVAVFNGTTASGLATKKANELKSYGYNVVTVDNAASRSYTNTILVDLTNGQKKYTKHYLEQRFNTSAVNSLPNGISNPNNADFVIVLGVDAE